MVSGVVGIGGGTSKGGVISEAGGISATGGVSRGGVVGGAEKATPGTEKAGGGGLSAGVRVKSERDVGVEGVEREASGVGGGARLGSMGGRSVGVFRGSGSAEGVFRLGSSGGSGNDGMD